MAKFSGEVVSEVVEIRFAFSGKVVFVGKIAGEAVKYGEIVASLDRKILQIELNRQLADYEKIRAEFEKSNKDSFKQAELDVSVNEVEIAKYKLDQSNLISPTNGTILEMGGLVSGLNITPAGSPVKIITQTKVFVFKVSQKDLSKFSEPQKIKISFEGLKEKIEGVTSLPFFGKYGKFEVTAKLDSSGQLLPGMLGQLSV